MTKQHEITITSTATPAVRNPNLDLIRCVAILLVVSVHFFLNADFYNIEIRSPGMVIAFLIRTGCMVSVPLFLLLTGYLCSRKQLSPAYFKKIIPVLTTYLLVCLMFLLKDIIFGHSEISPAKEIFKILAIENGAIRYAWYVEMYIGLFLLIPFLNLIYNNLPTKKGKLFLLGVFLFLTMAPLCLNDFDWLMPGFWKQLNASRTSQEILPAWWKGLWPLTYYFLGAYIREYDIKIPKWKNFLLLAASVLLFGLFECYRNWGYKFRELGSSQLGSLHNTLNSVLLFLFLLHLDLSRLPRAIIAVLNRISILSFGIYLCSDLTDTLVYRQLNQLSISFTVKYMSLPLVVLTSFLFAAVLSQFIAWVQTLLFRTVKQIRSASS